MVVISGLFSGMAMGTEWDYAWAATTEPDADGVFHVEGSAAKNYGVENGILWLETQKNTLLYWAADAGSDSPWDGGAPYTLEFRVRVGEKDGDVDAAAHVVVSNGQGKYIPIMLTNREWKTFRLEFDGQMGVLFEEGVEDPVWESAGQKVGNGSLPNRIYFGDGGTSTVGGRSEWEFLRWKRNQ